MFYSVRKYSLPGDCTIPVRRAVAALRIGVRAPFANATRKMSTLPCRFAAPVRAFDSAFAVHAARDPHQTMVAIRMKHQLLWRCHRRFFMPECVSFPTSTRRFL
jgi:hypothetical protein